MTIYPFPDKDKIDKCDWSTFLTVSTDPPITEDDQSTIALYFSQFCQPEIKAKNGDKKEFIVNCPQCKKRLNNPFYALANGGGFTWGIIHGQGHCRECRWPCAGHHYIRSPDGEDLVTIQNVPLAYHPEYVQSHG